MAVSDGQEDWWMASDGKLYPPHLHPGQQPAESHPLPLDSSSDEPVRSSVGPESTFKRLRYGGSCVSCGIEIPPGAYGWHDASIKKVACANCPPLSHSPSHADRAPGPSPANPAGGTSALAIANARHNSKFAKGATGEYLMAKALHEKLPPGSVILNDRSMPGTRANIDHIVVAKSGVWIIDSKFWKGLIQVKSTGGLLSSTPKLLLNGRDESAQVRKIYSQVIPVANLLNDPSIPPRPALVFIDGDWGAGVTLRVLQDRPFEMLGVMISWPKALIAKISEDGLLSPGDVDRIATNLDRGLPPAS